LINRTIQTLSAQVTLVVGTLQHHNAQGIILSQETLQAVSVQNTILNATSAQDTILTEKGTIEACNA